MQAQVEEEWGRQVADLEGEGDKLGPDSPMSAIIAVQLKLRMLEMEQRIISATGIHAPDTLAPDILTRLTTSHLAS
eukprot:1160000-Pelagomonas_calceolata.AAC.18